jgi:CheY-like chemotaxis protein
MSVSTILYVEDDENTVLLLRHALADGCVPAEMLAVENARDALTYLTRASNFADPQRPPLPALVLLDINLPGMPGWGVLAWMRRTVGVRALPVFMFSTSQAEQDVQQAYELGANGFLPKPPDFRGLQEVAAFLKDWLRCVRPPPLQ